MQICMLNSVLRQGHISRMRTFRIAVPFILAVALLIGIAADDRLFSVSAQTRLTYDALDTALKTKLPNQSFKTFPDLIKFLVLQVKNRKVDKPLTAERESALRNAGATDELIAAIRSWPLINCRPSKARSKPK